MRVTNNTLLPGDSKDNHISTFPATDFTRTKIVLVYLISLHFSWALDIPPGPPFWKFTYMFGYFCGKAFILRWESLWILSPEFLLLRGDPRTGDPSTSRDRPDNLLCQGVWTELGAGEFLWSTGPTGGCSLWRAGGYLDALLLFGGHIDAPAHTYTQAHMGFLTVLHPLTIWRAEVEGALFQSLLVSPHWAGSAPLSTRWLKDLMSLRDQSNI